MQLGAVAFVLAETILGKERAEVTHHLVARHFRNHTGGGDRQAVTIAVDDRGLREWKRKDGQSVDEDMIGPGKERGDRSAHCFVGRAQNVDSIDLDVIDHADRPNDVGIARKIDIHAFAQIRGKLLRIIEFTMSKAVRQNDGGRDNRTGQRAAPGFIDASDARDADGPQSSFVTESATPVHWDLAIEQINDLAIYPGASIVNSLTR